ESTWQPGEDRSAVRRRSPEEAPQLRLRAFEDALLPRAEGPSRAVRVEREHGHRRLVRRALPPLARFSRALEGGRDPARVGEAEDVLLEVERVAASRHLAGPVPAARGASPRRGLRPSATIAHGARAGNSQAPTEDATGCGVG